MARKTTQSRVQKAVKAFVESQEREQTPEEKRENAWFPMHIKSIIENENNICYENGIKTGESIIKVFGFDPSDAWKFAKGLQVFYSGVINAIEKCESEQAEPKTAETPSE